MAKQSAAQKKQEDALEELQSMQERLSHQIEQARARINEGLEGARDRMESAQDRAEDVWMDTVDYVRENPMTIAGASIGVGVAAGLLFYYMRARSQPGYDEY